MTGLCVRGIFVLLACWFSFVGFPWSQPEGSTLKRSLPSGWVVIVGSSWWHTARFVARIRAKFRVWVKKRDGFTASIQ